MDSWSKEQTDNMKRNGNVISNAKYVPNELRHPPPTNLMGEERDSELEKYIRSKYEYKRFMNSKPPASTSASSPQPPARPPPANVAPVQQAPTTNSSPRTPAPTPQVQQTVSVPSPPVRPVSRQSPAIPSQPAPQPVTQPQELISVQQSSSSSLPLQYTAPSPVINPIQQQQTYGFNPSMQTNVGLYPPSMMSPMPQGNPMVQNYAQPMQMGAMMTPTGLPYNNISIQNVPVQPYPLPNGFQPQFNPQMGMYATSMTASNAPQYDMNGGQYPLQGQMYPQMQQQQMYTQPQPQDWNTGGYPMHGQAQWGTF